MIFNSINVFENLMKDQTLLKCVGIARTIPAPEFLRARESNMDVKEIEERWMLESIAKGLIENKLVKFEAERTDDGNFKVSCMMLAIDPEANNRKEEQ